LDAPFVYRYELYIARTHSHKVSNKQDVIVKLTAKKTAIPMGSLIKLARPAAMMAGM